MQPALAQVCSLAAPFAQQIADYAAGHCTAIELWLTKLEDYLQRHSIDQVRGLLQSHGMAAPVASFQGGLLLSRGEARKEAWDHFARRLALCKALGTQVLVLAADFVGTIREDQLDRFQSSLRQAAGVAEEHGMRLALEFQGRAAILNNLQTAAVLVHEAGSPALGICLDVFHFAVGPSKLEDLGYLHPENLYHVQLCDLSGTLRELATDSQRILPGDGDLPLDLIVRHLKRIGYTGHVSVELMNPQMWQVGSLAFGEVAMTALRRILGQAGMGETTAEPAL